MPVMAESPTSGLWYLDLVASTAATSHKAAR